MWEMYIQNSFAAPVVSYWFTGQNSWFLLVHITQPTLFSESCPRFCKYIIPNTQGCFEHFFKGLGNDVQWYDRKLSKKYNFFNIFSLYCAENGDDKSSSEEHLQSSITNRGSYLDMKLFILVKIFEFYLVIKSLFHSTFILNATWMNGALEDI